MAEETEKAAILKKDEITSRARNAKAAKKEKSASKVSHSLPFLANEILTLSRLVLLEPRRSSPLRLRR